LGITEEFIKMTNETINEIVESFINGNVSFVREKVKRMSKRDLLDFVDVALCADISLYKIKMLLN
jgi:hypothetical protein